MTSPARKENPIRTVLADDHVLVRAGIRTLMERIPNVVVVGEAATGRQALEMVETKSPDLVLMDIAMADLNGLEALSRITADFPDVSVLILSAHANEEYVIRALRNGAAGYILKDDATKELDRAVASVSSGRTYLSPSISPTVIDSYSERMDEVVSPLEKLTPRQREILQLIGEGKNTKEIAASLAISIKTVESHRLQLMERLHIHHIPGLIRFAIRSGLASAEM